MKKLLLILTAIAFIGCSDDDSGTQTVSAIIGEWRQISNQTTDNAPVIDLSDCNQSPSAALFVFEENGGFIIKNACESEFAFEYTGTYSYDYELSQATVNYITPEAYVEKYSVTYEGDNKIGVQMFWSSIHGDIEGGYSVLKKQ